MHTQCPECKTKFLISDDQLRAAKGQVRCSKCHQVFNALDSLQKPQGSPPPVEPKPQDIPDTVTDFMSENDLEEFADLKAKITTDLDTEKKGAPETTTVKEEPEQKIDDDLSEVLKELERFENQSRQQPVPREEPLDGGDPSRLDDTAKEPNLKPPLHDPLELLNPKRPPKKKGGLLWSMGILLLLTVALAQLAWFGREQLMHYPEGRTLLQTACKYAGCELPTVRAPDKIQVLSRSILMHPEIENALLIQLTIANKADFPQPLPLLQISLFNSEERLVVQRRFKPEEYLAKDIKPSPMQPGKAIYVELAIEDPGDDVTGFKLDFF